MSAKAVVEHALRVYYADSRDLDYVVSKVLTMYEGEHAHELAEKQRAALEADPGILEPALINLIDPHCKDCRCLCHLADPSPCDDCREEADG